VRRSSPSEDPEVPTTVVDESSDEAGDAVVVEEAEEEGEEAAVVVEDWPETVDVDGEDEEDEVD